jgi:hypothetical protein
MFSDGIDKKSLVCLAAINTWYKIAYGKLEFANDEESRILKKQTKEMYYRLCDVENFAKSLSVVKEKSLPL